MAKREEVERVPVTQQVFYLVLGLVILGVITSLLISFLLYPEVFLGGMLALILLICAYGVGKEIANRFIFKNEGETNG